MSSSLVFLLGAVTLSIVGSCVLWLASHRTHRRPTPTRAASVRMMFGDTSHDAPSSIRVLADDE